MSIVKKIFTALILIGPFLFSCSSGNIYKAQHIKLIRNHVSYLEGSMHNIKNLFTEIRQDMDKENDNRRETAQYHWELVFDKIQIIHAKTEVIYDNMINNEYTVQFITSSRTANTNMLTHCWINQTEMEVYIDKLYVTELMELISDLENHTSDKIDEIIMHMEEYATII